jgi:hypothetical protein
MILRVGGISKEDIEFLSIEMHSGGNFTKKALVFGLPTSPSLATRISFIVCWVCLHHILVLPYSSIYAINQFLSSMTPAFKLLSSFVHWEHLHLW